MFTPRIAVILSLLIISTGINAQITVPGIDEVYGSDPLLYNGKYYTFYVPLNTGGHQYLSGKDFETGSVNLRDVTYNDLKLNYDIYNQQLILRYPDHSGAVSLIIISDAWLENFTLNDRHFELITLPDSTKKIFQVLGDGPIHILYHWKKDLELDLTYGAKNHIFTGAREMYLSMEGSIVPYRNNRSFYSLFRPDRRKSVREYARRHKINVKKAGDKLITGLINYCNNL